jgi:hypothetical protein
LRGLSRVPALRGKRDMLIQREFLPALPSAIAAVLAPLIIFLLERRGLARKAKEIEVVEKRVQIIDRLLTLEKHLPDETKNQLPIELANIAQKLVAQNRVAEQVRERIAHETSVQRRPIWRRFLLVYPLPTIRAHIYRGVFWFLLLLSVLFLSYGLLQTRHLPGRFMLLCTPGGFTMLVLPSLVVLLFNVVIGLQFRGAALRELKRFQATGI